MSDDKNLLKDKDDNKFDSFVDSIEEEIRNENWQKLWDKYGKIFSIAVIGGFFAIGVHNVWQRQDVSDREAISFSYTSVQGLIMSGNTEGAVTRLKELSNVSKKDYATMARIEYAALLRSKKNKQAITEYKSIAGDKDANELLSDLAYIFYVNTCLDLMPIKDLMSSLDDFIATLKAKYVGGSWDLFAKETLAFCYMKIGNAALAKEALESLAKTAGIPNPMLERTKSLLHSLEG
ncbi:MAG: tetratricopeptide repeat protein [Holosporales bacterium]|jgi:hypothetical protein|nr:tetratricopeptide repeat protein [Holosporales bacterium]